MKHPLAGKNGIFYVAAWAVVCFLHAALLYGPYGFPLKVAVADSLVFNLLVAALGAAYWYVVKYVGGRNAPMTLLNHALGMLFSVSLLSVAGYTLLRQISGVPRYADFLPVSLPWHIFAGLLYTILIALVYGLFRYQYDSRLKEKKATQLQHLLKQSELEMLKFQINPHFIFNSLNSISALTLSAPDQAREMTVKLAEFFRSSLGSGDPGVHSLKEELARIQLYLDIEKVRFGERLQVETDMVGECSDMTLPSMILQPLYENAIKHGIYGQLENVLIHTRLWLQDGMLYIALSNTFGPESSPRTGKGIGLANVNSRLELAYGIPDLVSIEKGPGLFTVHLKIPQTQNP